MAYRPSQSTAVDLYISIGALSEGYYPIRATITGPQPIAQARLTRAHITKILDASRRLINGGPFDEASLIGLGRLNFEALISGEVRDAYRDIHARLDSWQHLRILLDIEPRQLQPLPWELVYDPWLKEFVGDRDRVTFIRYADTPRRTKPTTPPEIQKVKILVVVSGPRDLEPLQVEQEISSIKETIVDEIRQDWITIELVGGKLEEIKRGLAGDPDVLHFIGHGGIVDGIPGIYLENQSGKSEFTNPTSLDSRLFRPLEGRLNHLRLIILNACRTSETPLSDPYESLAHHLVGRCGSVVAMQYPISDGNSAAFSMSLYQNLATSTPLDLALAAARQAIHTGDPNLQRDWLAPVLVSNGEDFEITRQFIPFKGTHSYTINDQPWFLGRKNEIAYLQELVDQHPLIVVNGPSTCGKTSLLLAGYTAEAVRTRPVIYATLSDDLEAQLRTQFNKILVAQNKPPLPEGDISSTLANLPSDLVIILDRAELASTLGETTQALLSALVDWAMESFTDRSGGRLMLATRPDDSGKVPEYWRGKVPDLASAQLQLEMLSRDDMASMILDVTNSTPVKFTDKAISKILTDLHYEEEPKHNMMAVQVVCLALYNRAREKRIKTITPELISPSGLGEVSEILAQNFELALKLSQPIYSGGEVARKILAQCVRSDGRSARSVPEETFYLRINASQPDIKRLLDQLEEDGILISQNIGGRRVYEWAHEALALQMDWVSEADRKLRRLEEILESTGEGLLPRRSEKGGLEDLSASRDDGTLKLLPSQKVTILVSALEAGFEVQEWVKSTNDPELTRQTLTTRYLSAPARRRAVEILGLLAKQEDEVGKQARLDLLHWAEKDDIPIIRHQSALVVAPILSKDEFEGYFGRRERPLDEKTIQALALIYDRAGLKLAQNDRPTQFRVVSKALNLAAPGILKTAVQCGILAACGFVLVAGFNWYRNIIQEDPTPLNWLTLLPAGLLVLFLTFLGTSLIAFCREVFTILGGGRRARYTVLGSLLGGASGFGLSIFLLSTMALAGSNFSIGGILLPTMAGGVVGLIICAGWSLSLIGHSTNPQVPPSRRWHWLGMLCAIGLGAVSLFLIETGLDWWPDTYYFLTPSISQDLWIIGGILGLFTALGLNWAKLPQFTLNSGLEE